MNLLRYKVSTVVLNNAIRKFPNCASVRFSTHVITVDTPYMVNITPLLSYHSGNIIAETF